MDNMTYKAQLIEHYKQVHRRIEDAGKRYAEASEPKPLPRAGLSPRPPAAPATPLQAALKITRPEPVGRRYPLLPPLPGLNPSPTGFKNRWMTLLALVATKHSIDPDEIMSQSRLRNIVTARNEVIYRLRTDFGYGWSEISRTVQRDRSTILHSVEKVYQSHIDDFKNLEQRPQLLPPDAMSPDLVSAAIL